MSLYENINKRKKAGTSRSKKNSTISKKSYANMKKGFPKYQSGGLVKAEIARGCGAVMGDRRKVTKHYQENIMDWFQSKAAQVIGLVSIIGTLAGFGYTGATYVNRIENLEKKIGRIEGTEDAQQAIEERFSAIETSVTYINKSIDDSIVPEVKENSNMIKVIDIDISTATTQINAIENRVKRIEDKDDNPLAN